MTRTSSRSRRSRWLAALTIGLLTATLAAAPAHASDRHPADVTSSGFAPADEEAALRAKCANQTASFTLPGWFDQRLGHCIKYQTGGAVVTRQGEVLGEYFVTFNLLGFAGGGSRVASWAISLDDLRVTGLDANKLRLMIGINGCQGVTNLVCPTTPLQRTDNVPGWKASPKFPRFAFSSPNGTGADPYKTVSAQMSMDVVVEYLDARTLPMEAKKLLYSNIRFDSVGSALGGKYHGSVFTDPIPVFTLSLTDPLVNESAAHIRDAQLHPEVTFPSWLGKHVPGAPGTTPLTRLMNATDKNRNRDVSVAICKDVWGDYDGTVQNCDEYPFATTKEGAFTATNGGTTDWPGSVRLIDAQDNQRSGRDNLQNGFYSPQRLLDGDRFYVKILP